MKSTVSHLVLVLTFSIIASVNVFAQKRFDNLVQNKKIVVTKSGPKSQITEEWVPIESYPHEYAHDTLKAIIQNAKSTNNVGQDSVKYYNLQKTHIASLNHGQDPDLPKRRGNSRDVVMKGNKIKQN